MKDVRGFAHDWQLARPSARVGVVAKPWMRCSVCKLLRRWSPVMERYCYYTPTTGFIGHRPGRCRTHPPKKAA